MNPFVFIGRIYLIPKFTKMATAGNGPQRPATIHTFKPSSI